MKGTAKQSVLLPSNPRSIRCRALVSLACLAFRVNYRRTMSQAGHPKRQKVYDSTVYACAEKQQASSGCKASKNFPD